MKNSGRALISDQEEVMKKVPLSLIVLMLVLCCFLSCSLPLAEAPKEIEDNKEEVTEPVPPAEKQKKEYLLPISLDEFRSNGASSRHVISGNPYNEDGTFNEYYVVASPSFFCLAFAGLGKREVSEDMTYEMIVHGTPIHCTLKEEAEVYIIEGRSDENDTYIYMKQKKDGSEISIVEIAKFYWPREDSQIVDESVIVRYAPSMKISGNCFNGHYFSFEVGKMEEEWGMTTVDEYIYKNDDFLGYAFVDGLGDSKSAPLEGTPDLLEMSIDNAMYIYENFTDSADLENVEVYRGAFFFFQKKNDYRFESVGSAGEKRSFQEIADQARELNENWILDHTK